MIKSMTMAAKLTTYLSVCLLLATACSAAPPQSRQGLPPPHPEHLTFTLTKGGGPGEPMPPAPYPNTFTFFLTKEEAVDLLLTFMDYVLKSESITFSTGVDYLVSAGISVENLTYEEILALLDEYLKT